MNIPILLKLPYNFLEVSISAVLKPVLTFAKKTKSIVFIVSNERLKEEECRWIEENILEEGFSLVLTCCPFDLVKVKTDQEANKFDNNDYFFTVYA